MNEETQKQEDEISLIDLFVVLWRRKVMIIVITLLGVIGAVVYSLISIKLPPEKSFLPNYYTPEALVLIDNKSSGGGLSSMLNSSGMGGLLAGLSLSSGSSFSDLAVYLFETNSLLDAVVDEFDLIKKYNVNVSPRATTRKTLKKILKAEYNSRSGVFIISFTDIDPVFAKDVVNYCTSYLERRFNELGLDKNKIQKENLEISIASTFQEILKLEEESRNLEHSVASTSFSGRLPAITTNINRIELELKAQQDIYAQLKVQYELLKIDMASEKPVLQILEMAEILDRKSGPSRGRLCIIVTFAAGFFAVFLAFVLNAIANIKNDPEAMAKLRGTKTNDKK